MWKGKALLVEYMDEFHRYQKHTDSLTPDQYRVWFGFGVMEFRYAVLTDDTFCEWEKITEGENKNYFRSQCQRNVGGLEGANRLWLPVAGQEPFCGHCGLPIKVIEDEQPMELDGVKPETINQRLDVWEARYIKPGITIYIYGESKKQVTERWNSWVKRVSKQ